MLKGRYKHDRRRVIREDGSRLVGHWLAPPGASRCGSVQEHPRGEQEFPPRHFWQLDKVRFRERFVAFFAAILVTGGAFAGPPGAVISNQASVDYLDVSGQPATVQSNTVQVVSSVARSPATVELTRVVDSGSGDYAETVGPSACFQGGVFTALADPVLMGGSSIDPSQVQGIATTMFYNLGEPIFLRLSDSDQNLDNLSAEHVEVTLSNATSGDSETIQLTETGVDTGVFAGFVPSSGGPAVAGDCVLQGASRSDVIVNYADPADATDMALDSAQFDPVQRVFESRTGAVISGVTIELVDAISGLPATVYGNDGVSLFPSSIVSGATATDSSGTSYVFGPGEYRFPVVPDGDYRLIITPPPAYAAPSQVSIADLQSLPGAPFALVPASFGAEFTKSGEPSFAADVPVDPQPVALFLQKKTTSTNAAPGDFVRYELMLENASTIGTANDIQILDQLPPGVRFVTGSVMIDGVAAPDPTISPESGTLEFSITPLDIGERATLFYVAEIISGERDQELVNRATAFAGAGLISNEATAMIRVTEDLFRSSSTLIGRVLEADCSQDTFSEEQGVADIRVYLEDGRYAVTDQGGRFHFEGLKPGTHVAQLDTFTVPDYLDVVGCSDTPGFAGRADSQFVKLSRGSLGRADFFLQRKPAPEGRIDIELRNLEADSAEHVAYELKLNGTGNVAIENIELTVILPDGVHYLPKTMRVDGQDRGDPRSLNQGLVLAVDDRFGNWSSEISFRARIDNHIDGELVTKAVAKFDSALKTAQRTPVVETKMIREPAKTENEGYVLDLKFDVLSAKLSSSDMLQLDTLSARWKDVRDIEISAVGHSDSQRISARNRHIFADNYELSRARATAAAVYLAKALNNTDGRMQVEGRGPDDPIMSNETAEGRSKNRRVELIMSGVRPSKPSFLEVTQASSGLKETATRGAVPGTELDQSREDAYAESIAGMPASQIEVSIESLQPNVALLLPEKTFQPAIPTTKISVQHDPLQTVKVYLNNATVSPLNFDALEHNAARTVAVSTWKGVDLEDGDNQIRVVVTNADGTPAKTLRRTIYYSGPAIRGEFVPELSTLIADGKTVPVVAIRLFDRAGKPSRSGTTGAFRIDAPYRAKWDVENDRKNKLVEIGPREPIYRVGADSIALIELAPTTRSGELTLNLKFDNYREQELRAWLTPAARDWILVGFAEGSMGHATLSENMGAALAAGHEDGYYDNGRVAFFAKGQIKGEYLLTLAYDSDRERKKTRNRFETVVDPNAYYSLYADTSEQRFEASSQRKLFLKLERNQFFALFGDFDTGLSVTDLARYERRFNGFKSEYRGDSIGYNVFAADTNQSFNRDEIRGDGTSGLYRLSRAPIIANSDIVRIEVRDRLDTSVVLSSTNLSRFLDYNLDTLNGTIFFKQPVPSRDFDFNPIYIIAEYESASTGTEDVVIGGRASARLAEDALEIGLTHIKDDTQGAEADLTGVDLRWQINDQTLLKAEYAASNSTLASVDQSGSASSISIEHNSEAVDVTAYVREVEEEFGLGYQSAADEGFRRFGLDARLRVGEFFQVEGEAAWQQNLETTDIRNLARAQLRYQRSAFTASLGVTHAADKFDDGETRNSELAELGISQKLFQSRLTLRASGSTALSGEAEDTDFPTRFILGADYNISQDIALIAEYEDSSGKGVESTMTRLGVRATPWSRSQVSAYLNDQVTEFGPRLFANVGLVQGFQLNERWTVDVGIDQNKTFSNSDARVFDPDRELVSGSLNEDFVAVYMGAMYSADLWSANSRIEFRDSDSEQRSTLLVGWYREPTAGHGFSASLALMQSDNITGNELSRADFKFGWAYRMSNGKWSFLDRVDLVFDKSTLSQAQQHSWRVINNFNANKRFGATMQMSLQYASKYVRSEFDDDAYSGYTDLVGFDLRRGMRKRWDAGVNTSIYHSYRSGVIDYGIGIDAGYNLRDNMWLTLGYNIAGFYDSDLARARYTAQGPYLRFSIKADQHTLKNIAGRR